MDIVELGAIGELVGGVAVIGSLIYVGLQVRESTISRRSDTFAGLADAFNRFNLAVATDPALAGILDRGRVDRSNLEPGERVQFDYFILGIFRTIETLFYQTRQGTAETDLWEAVRRDVEFEMSHSGMRSWWRSTPHAFTKAFSGFIEQVREEKAPS